MMTTWEADMNMSELPKPKVIRAEKSGNRNIDDGKVLIVGMIIFVVLVVVQNWVFPDFIVLEEKAVATEEQSR